MSDFNQIASVRNLQNVFGHFRRQGQTLFKILVDVLLRFLDLVKFRQKVRQLSLPNFPLADPQVGRPVDDGFVFATKALQRLAHLQPVIVVFNVQPLRRQLQFQRQIVVGIVLQVAVFGHFGRFKTLARLDRAFGELEQVFPDVLEEIFVLEYCISHRYLVNFLLDRYCRYFECFATLKIKRFRERSYLGLVTELIPSDHL